jgi:hypothetical protein
MKHPVVYDRRYKQPLPEGHASACPGRGPSLIGVKAGPFVIIRSRRL